MQNNNWTSAWPTEPGNYWFHGWLNKNYLADEPKTYLVRIPSDRMVCLAEGWAVWKDEGAKGLWLPAEVPEPSEFNVE